MHHHGQLLFGILETMNPAVAQAGRAGSGDELMAIEFSIGCQACPRQFSCEMIIDDVKTKHRV